MKSTLQIIRNEFTKQSFRIHCDILPHLISDLILSLFSYNLHPAELHLKGLITQKK